MDITTGIKMVAVVLTAIAAILFLTREEPKGRYYDCSIAEFHPDYPPKVKEECRKLRMNKKTLTV